MVGAPMDVHHHRHRHNLKSMVVSLLALLSFFCPNLAQGRGQLPLSIAGRNTTSSQLQTYIVHVRKPQHLLSAGLAELESWHKSFLPTQTLDSGEPRMVYSYEHAISGFAAKLTPAEVEAMAANKEKEGFLFAHADEPLVFETTWIHSFMDLTNSERDLWNSSYFAKGIIVAIIDSGINPGHAAFDDSYIPDPPGKWKGRCDLRSPNKCNKKLIGARNFDSAGPGAEPLDNTGHGTFVASVVGSNVVIDASVNGLADGNAFGTSPGVHLAVYRADTAAGVVASFDQAIKDGVDVITVSVSLPRSGNDLAIAALSAVERGIFVSCAAGNGGPHRGSVRNDSPWVLTVGASTMDRALRVFLELGSGQNYSGESLQRPGNFPTGQLGIVYPGAGSNMLKTCSAPLNNVAGKAVLCESDPAVSTVEQGENVRNSKGAAMILMNSRHNGSTLMLYDNVIPTVAVTYQDSQQIMDYVRSAGGRGTVVLKAEGTIYALSPSPTVASISGRGPSKDNGGVLKPDIIGPGINIMGASSTSSKGYVMMSGTSVAAPVLASVAALLRTNHSWTPAGIRSAIMTSSIYLDNSRTPIVDETGLAASAFAVGAGHVHPNRAANPGLVYDIQPGDYVRYSCGLYRQQEQVDAVARRGVDCARLGSISAEELNYPSIAVALSPQGKTVKRRVRNEGPPRSSYRAEVVGMSPEVQVVVNPDMLQFRSKGEEQSFTVSFTLVGPPGRRGKVYEGHLKWVATTSLHVVRSPLVVTVM